MRKVMIGAACVVVGHLAAYFVMTFALWNFDVAMWPADYRLGMMLIGAGFSGFAVIAVSLLRAIR